VATARQILGATVRKQHRTAWVVRDNVELETPVERLQPGDLLTIRAGETLPVDGKVVSGTAMVDESLVRGSVGLVCRTIEQSILRGTLVVEGDLQVQVVHCGQNTVAERIGQALDAATRETSLSIKQAPPTIARRSVPPVLLTAGVGLMVGDVTTAGAILRPDYATGPGMGNALLLVHQLGTCLQAGMIVRQAEVFPIIARVDLVLVDRHPALERRQIEVDQVTRSGTLNESELLQLAECALRGICDPRSAAIASACDSRQLPRLSVSAECRAGGVELFHCGRHFRIAGETVAPLGHESFATENPSGTIEVQCDGHSVGTVTFRTTSRLAARSALAGLRTEHRIQVGLLTPLADHESDQLVASLEIDFRQVCPTDADKAQYIANCRNAGHRVAYVGDCEANPLAAAAADVAIAPVDEPGAESDPANVWLLRADYSRLGVLCEVARSSRRQQQVQHGLTLIPNLACVAGAFFFGFTSLAAVVISNLGTYTVYRRSVRTLRQTESRLLSRRLPMQRLRNDTATARLTEPVVHVT
jgi:Cu2+-exporting ATPase